MFGQTCIFLSFALTMLNGYRKKQRFSMMAGLSLAEQGNLEPILRLQVAGKNLGNQTHTKSDISITQLLLWMYGC